MPRKCVLVVFTFLLLVKPLQKIFSACRTASSFKYSSRQGRNFRFLTRPEKTRKTSLDSALQHHTAQLPRATVSSSHYLCALSSLGLIYFWQVTIPRLQEASCELGLSNDNSQELQKPVYLVIITPILQSLEGLLGSH